MVGGQLGSPAQLGGQGVDELRHAGGGGVVPLAEVVGHGGAGEQGGACQGGANSC